MNILNLSPQQLRHAASIKDQIERLHNQLSSLLDGSIGAAPGKRHTMSAAAKARIAAAQRARWAKYKAKKK